MALSSPQARRLPQARERGPEGRPRPQVVELPRPATSWHAGWPNRLRAVILSSSLVPSARGARLLSERREVLSRNDPAPSSLPAPYSRPKSQKQRLHSLPCPRGGDLSSDWRAAPPTRDGQEGGAYLRLTASSLQSACSNSPRLAESDRWGLRYLRASCTTDVRASLSAGWIHSKSHQFSQVVTSAVILIKSGNSPTLSRHLRWGRDEWYTYRPIVPRDVLWQSDRHFLSPMKFSIVRGHYDWPQGQLIHFKVVTR